MSELIHLSARILNTALLLEPGYACTAISGIANRLGVVALQDGDQLLNAQQMETRAAGYQAGRDRDRPYQVVEGAAILPVSGSLVHKSGNLRPFSGTTGYDGIIGRAADAFADPDVKGVLLDNDTPGGEVAGCFDTARSLRKMADESGKPLWAACWDMNCSAGMALASAANRRLITQTGIAGSIGVVMAHASYEKQLEAAGIKVTLIHSGAQKANGNPYQDLSADVLAQFQQSSDQLRLEFAELVSAHTGISVGAILEMEAATYRGQEAVDAGLADDVINGHEIVAHFVEHLSTQGRTITIGATMAEETLPAPQATEPASAPAAAVPDAAADKQAERTRIAGILSHPSAEGRGKLANHLALNTDLSVEAAAAVLAEAEQQRDSANMETALDSMMAGQDLEVGADTAGEGADAETDMVGQVMGAWKAATGAT